MFKKYTSINHKKEEEEEEEMSIAWKIQEKYVYQDKQSQLQRKPVQQQWGNCYMKQHASAVSPNPSLQS